MTSIVSLGVLVHCHFHDSHDHVRCTFERMHGRTLKCPEVDLAKMLMHVVAMVSSFRSLWRGKDGTTRHD